MIESLAQIFDNLDLAWIDSSKEILTSQAFTDLLSMFPNLKEIFQEGENNDKDEYHRTVRHIFRSLKVFSLLKDGNFIHDSLSQSSLEGLKDKINRINSINEKFLPLIFIYHDIGRFYDKKDHPYKSHEKISNKKLLDSFNLKDDEKLIIDKIIQYHLLFASIYTGEATYFGVNSLLNDSEFIKLLPNEKYRELFVDLFEIFTYIDILGYSYAKVFDHYIKYFNEINQNLKQIFSTWPNKEKAMNMALNISNNWIEWRIAGATRIFQFIETKPYLTREFYFRKLEDSLNETEYELNKKLNLVSVKNEYLACSSQIQIKYGLGFLMVLAFGNFFRSRMKKDIKISPKLITFWLLLCKEIDIRSKGDKFSLWNIYFINLPNLYKADKVSVKKLDFKTMELIIKNSKQEYDEKRKEYGLFLNFKDSF